MHFLQKTECFSPCGESLSLFHHLCQERGLGRRRGPWGVSKLPPRDNHKIATARDGKGGKKQQNCLEPLQASLMRQSAKMLN